MTGPSDRHLVRGGADTGKAMDRVVAFSDGVFAFAITLLVVTLDVPEISSALAARDLPGALLDQAPRFGAYALSFWLVAIYWLSHHRMYRYIVRYDTRLLQINLLILFWVAFLPYPVELMGRYGDLPIAAAFYATIMAMVGFSSAGVWAYARRHGMLSPDTPGVVVEHFTWRGLTTPLIWLASVPLAFIYINAAYVLWFSTFIAHQYVSRRFGSAGLT